MRAPLKAFKIKVFLGLAINRIQYKATYKFYPKSQEIMLEQISHEFQYPYFYS